MMRRMITISAPTKFAGIMTLIAILDFAPNAAAQSYKKSQDLGARKYKSWDDVPSPHSSSTSSALSLIYNPNPDPSLISVPDKPYLTQEVPPLLRRRLPETQELQLFFEEILAEPSDNLVKKAGLQLELPGHEQWFAQQFGAERGKLLAGEYKKVRRLLTLEFVALVKQLRTSGQTRAHVTMVRSASDREADPQLKAALTLMQKPLELYTVRMHRPGAPSGGYQLLSFAYVDGAFRFLGRMQGAEH